jgi:signal transduction histidine kinase
MREQTELLGGSFDVRSQPGSGTRVRIEWPLAPVSEENHG